MGSPFIILLYSISISFNNLLIEYMILRIPTVVFSNQAYENQ